MATSPGNYDSPYKQQKTISNRLTVEAGTNKPKRVKQSEVTFVRDGLGNIVQSPDGFAATQKAKLQKGK